MRVLILDPFHGSAGDMVAAALLDCGADKELVVKAMASVVAEPFISTVTRCGIRATRVETRAGRAQRTLEEVLARCDQADAPQEALAMAYRVFRRIAAAEERVHGAKTHFHEVGADDAIADVIGACTALYTLGVGGVTVLPVALGVGMVQGSHGKYPVPAPATVAILEGSGLSTTAGNEPVELCTPTGAALLVEFSTLSQQKIGAYKIVRTGYGAGTRNPQDIPNVLRAMVVETAADAMPQDSVDILETNVDDISGEVLAHVIARCMEEGARDAGAIPMIMKKGRPGHLVRVICPQDKSPTLAELLARELGTLGIRCSPMVHRFIAERTMEMTAVVVGGKLRKLPVKFGWLHGMVFTVKPEFEPARQWALELGVPVREVLQAAAEAGWREVKKWHEEHA
ncbi:MAG: hypothetical protein A4E35_01345 [Methanoregula sp. PtaU1.Bin051]|nr:MAG: hypothetical protein A4E35_01345 [Methanoregula sp. PtaU1.Bin051]